MPVNKIAIIGLGLIGGSIAKALRNGSRLFHISAFDKKEILEAALKENVIDKPLANYENAVNSDLIFLCLPVSKSLEVFSELLPMLNSGQIITDVCGVKLPFREKLEQLKSGNSRYFGGHPMTGKEKGGYENSDPLLFENAVYILNGIEEDNLSSEFIEVIKLLGANIISLSAELHDEIVSSVSHMPQLLSVALVNAAARNKDGIDFTNFAAGGFRDMTRIASSDFGVWEDILLYNKSNISSAFESLKQEIEEMKILVETGSLSDLKEKFEQARCSRDEVPKSTKGFLNPLHDIFVFVKDEPGVISKISTALFNENINIKDIELLKIREGTGGVFRLSFESFEESKQAENHLQKLGFTFKNQ